MLKWFLLALVAVYVLNPFDLLPDMAVGLGWLDDLGLMALLWYYFMQRGRADTRQGSGGGAESARQERQASADVTDPYAVLELPPGAGQEEIRKAYRRLAAQYHPDKVAHLGDDLRILAERKFKAIQAAYDTLRRR